MVRRRDVRILGAALCLASVLALGPASIAAATDGASRRLAISLAEDGRCEPALEVFDRIRTEPREDAETARLEGACALRLQDFRRAVDALEVARALDPEAPDVDLLLGMAAYHAGEVVQAREAIDRAATRDPDRAEVLLYAGLVSFAEREYATAAGRLDAASQRIDARVEPMASFYLGRARLGSDDHDRARTAFEQVVRDHAGTPWAEEASRALAEMDRSAFAWWASLELGYEYDDNALLRGSAVSLPDDVSGQSDHRGFWFVDVGATLFEAGGFTGGAALRYAGSEHHELERFDTHSPGATVWVDRPLDWGGASVRLQYDVDSPFIDFKDSSPNANRDPFVLSQVLGASLYKPWEDRAYTTVGVSLAIEDYGYARFDTADNGVPGGAGADCVPPTLEFCGPAINEEDATDRDGRGVVVSLLHHLALPIDVSWLEAPWGESGYRYVRYWSEGSEYDLQRHEVSLGVGVGLPFELGLRVSGRYAWVPHENPTVFPDPADVAAATSATPPTPPGREYFLSTSDREEHEAVARVSLERALGDLAVLTARYGYTRNFSNADVFDYERHLFGVSVRVGLGGP